MTRRRLLLALIGLVSVPVVSGCGGDDAGAGKKKGKKNNNAPQPKS